MPDSPDQVSSSTRTPTPVDVSDDELEAIADAREAEMESDPSMTLSHEDMLIFIQSRRR